jgi:hypothetical protein
MADARTLPQARSLQRNMSRLPMTKPRKGEPQRFANRFRNSPGERIKPDEELDMKRTLMLGAATLALAIAAPSFAQDRTSPGSPGTKPPATQTDKRADQASQERMARLKSAEPAQKLAVSGDAIIGTEVRNTQDEKIGTVKDIILTDGKISAIVVARGGVLGMGTDYHQVEFGQVKMTSDMETVVLDLSEDQVKALPKMAYEKGKWGPAPAKADKGTSPPARTSPAAPPSRSTDTAPKTDAPAKKEDAPAPKNQ